MSPECPEWDGLTDNLDDDSTLHGYQEPHPEPPLQKMEEGPDLSLHDRRLNRGAHGPVRIGPEIFPSSRSNQNKARLRAALDGKVQQYHMTSLRLQG